MIKTKVSKGLSSWEDESYLKNPNGKSTRLAPPQNMMVITTLIAPVQHPTAHGPWGSEIHQKRQGHQKIANPWIGDEMCDPGLSFTVHTGVNSMISFTNPGVCRQNETLFYIWMLKSLNSADSRSNWSILWLGTQQKGFLSKTQSSVWKVQKKWIEVDQETKTI